MRPRPRSHRGHPLPPSEIAGRALRAAAGTTLVNSAAVAGAQDDLDLGDNAAIVRSPDVDPLYDLGLTKSAAPAAPAAGGSVTYTLVATNQGPSAAPGVVVSDLLPDGLTATEAEASQGACTAGEAVSCALGTVPAGGSARVVITATVAASLAGRTIENVATAAAAAGRDERPEDNAARASIQPVQAAAADLAVTQAGLDPGAPVGGTVRYRLVVTNLGAGVATDARVTDTPGPGLAIVSAPGCTGTRPAVCRLGTLAPGQRATVVVRARVTRAGALRNTAAVTATAPDPNSGNNRAVATARGAKQAAPRLQLTHRANRPAVVGGNRVRFTTAVRATGAGVARNIRVCVSLPAGLSAVRAPAVRRETARTCFTIPRLAAGQTRTFSLLAVADRVDRPRTAASVATLEGSGPRRRAAAVVAILAQRSGAPAVTG